MILKHRATLAWAVTLLAAASAIVLAEEPKLSPQEAKQKEIRGRIYREVEKKMREQQEQRQRQVTRERAQESLAARPALAPERLDRLFGALDANGDGRIDREELGDRLPGILHRLRQVEGPAAPGEAGRPPVGPEGPGPRPGPALLEELQRRLDERIERQVNQILEKRVPEMIERKLHEARMRVGPELLGRGPEARAPRPNDGSAFRPPGRDLAPADGARRDPLAGPRLGPGDRPVRPEARAPRGLWRRGGGPPAFRRPGAGSGSRRPAAGQRAFRMLDANRDGRLQVEEVRRMIGLLDKAAAASEREPMGLDAWQKLLGENRPSPGPSPEPEPKRPRPDDRRR